MKKIDALSAILGTNKIAFNPITKEAFDAVGGVAYSYRVGDAVLSQYERDYHVNLRLLEEGWEVSDKHIGMLEDFEFPPVLQVYIVLDIAE